jgi:hypothetical protein
MNWEINGRKRSWPVLSLSTFRSYWGKTRKILRQESLSPDPDWESEKSRIRLYTEAFLTSPWASTEHYAMKAYWGSEGKLHTFLTSALDGGEWSASHTGCFTPRERASGAHLIGGWVGPRAGPDAVMKRKIPSPSRDSNPQIIHPVAERYTTELSRLLL